MRKLLLAATAIALLAGCREAVEDQPENEAQSPAINNATVPPEGEANSAVINNAAAVEPANATGAAMIAAASPLGAPVSGDAAKKLMHDRHEGMEEIGDAMKLVSRELRGDSPDLAKVRDGAGTMARLAPQVSGWFPPGTGPDVGKTGAKPEIWQKPEDFAAKTRAFQQAAQRFNAAAKGSDLAAIRAGHGDLGKSCKACHDLYREEDH